MAQARVRTRASGRHRGWPRHPRQNGFEGRYDHGARGPVTSLAASLSDEAAGGQILLGQRTFAALEGQVEAKSVGELQIKGFSRPCGVPKLRSAGKPAHS